MSASSIRAWAKSVPLIAAIARELLRPIRRRRQRPAIQRTIALSRSEASRIFEEFKAKPSRLFIVEYNNESSPPTYGDLMQVMMLARFLCLNGLQVEFRIVDNLNRRSDWEMLSTSEISHFLSEQVKLGEELLPANCKFRVTETSDSSSDPTFSPNSYRIFDEMLGLGHALYGFAPCLLTELIESRYFQIPPNFLLKAPENPSHQSQNIESLRPYIGWHIRFIEAWGLERNATSETIIKDFLQLRKLFPGHSLMIISTPEGVAQALSSLDSAKLIDSLEGTNVSVIPQPEIGFLNALPYLLNADFYFQRLGGGIGMIPIFSDVPYLFIAPDGNYYFLRDGTRLVPWAKPHQKFVVSPRAKGRMPIRVGLNH